MLVSGGRVEPFDGDLDDYRRFLLAAGGTPAQRAAAKPKAGKRATGGAQAAKGAPTKGKATKKATPAKAAPKA